MLNVNTGGDLFSTSPTNAPLAFRQRPKDFKEFQGLEELKRKAPFLFSGDLPSCVIFGPPGSGKTTLAHLLVNTQNRARLYPFNAVTSGIPELKKLLEKAKQEARDLGLIPIIFIDEIHRFNKSQQDALLPWTESGEVKVMGATTEDPRYALNPALLSRLSLIELKALDDQAIAEILERALRETNEEFSLSKETQELIIKESNGDARRALHLLEKLIMAQANKEVSVSDQEILLSKNHKSYHLVGNEHYDCISAFIKSMRGSDVQAALYWLAVMLEGGEDPRFIARRLVIFASEDIGNADPSALNLAVSALTAAQSIGMPEIRINLAQVTSYLTLTYKSNSAYQAINEAMDWVNKENKIEVPDFLKSRPKGPLKYASPHNHPERAKKQKYTTQEIPEFYRPNSVGKEEQLKKRYEWLKEN